MNAQVPWWRSRLAGLLLFALGIVVFGVVVESPYHLNLAIRIGMYGLVAVGLGLLMGWTGQVSLGHAGFYGIGAYTSAILTTRSELSPWLALVAGAVVTAVLAYAVGRPTLKLHGHYLAMGTLGLGLIIQTIFVQADQWTEGPHGIASIPYLSLGGLPLSTDQRYYWLVWPVCWLGLVLAGNVMNSRMGRALRAVGQDEGAAAAAGVDVSSAKLSVFVLSAVYASVAGSLYAHYLTYISPSPFGFAFSIQLMVMVVIGGAHTVWGPLTGAGVLILLEQLLVGARHRLPALDGFEIGAYGAILVLFLLFRPQGLVAPLRPRRVSREVTRA